MFGLSDKATYRLLATLRARIKSFGEKSVGLSRHEWYKFGTSEWKLREIIKNLIAEGKMKVVGQARCTGVIHICNVYEISKEFVELIRSIKEIVDLKSFEYTIEDVFEFAKKYGKKKSTEWKIKIGDRVFIIGERGRYRGKVYSVEDNKIVSLHKVKALIS